MWPALDICDFREQFISQFLDKRRVSLAGRHINKIKDGAVLFSFTWFIIMIIMIMIIFIIILIIVIIYLCI